MSGVDEFMRACSCRCCDLPGESNHTVDERHDNSGLRALGMRVVRLRQPTSFATNAGASRFLFLTVHLLPQFVVKAEAMKDESSC
jgi:hypothetical protein